MGHPKELGEGDSISEVEEYRENKMANLPELVEEKAEKELELPELPPHQSAIIRTY